MKIIFATAFIAAVGNAAELPSEAEYDFSFLDNLNFDFNETAEALELQNANNLGVNAKHLPWFFGGLFQSVLGHSDMHDLNNCLGGIGHIAGEVEGTVKDIGSHSFKAAFKHLGNVVNSLPGEFNSCGSSKGDMQKLVNWAKRFGNPTAMAERVAKEVITHSQHIFNEAKRTVDYWNKDDLYQSGQNFGDFLTTVFGGVNGIEFEVMEFEDSNNLGVNAKHLPWFFGGLFQSVIGHSDMHDLNSCLGGIGHIAGELEGTVKDIGSHSFKAAFKHFLNVINAIPGEFNSCKGSKNDMQKMVNWAKRFGSPVSMAETVAKHLITHSQHIFNEIKRTVHYWNSDDLYQSGSNFGDFLTSVFGGINGVEFDLEEEANNLSVDIRKIPQFLGGILQAFFGHSDLNDLNSCINDIKQLSGEIEAGVKDLGNHSWKSAFTNFGKVVSALPNDIKDCKGSKADLEKFVNWGKRFSNPTSMAASVAKEVASHSEHIYNDASRSVNYWKQGDLYQSGQNFGDILVTVFGGANSLEVEEEHVLIFDAPTFYQ